MSTDTIFDITPYKEKLIDIYTKFYGEHNRAFVELKFNKITFLNMYDFQSLMYCETNEEKKKQLFDFEEKVVNFLQEKLKSAFPNLNEKLLYIDDIFNDGLIESFEYETEGELNKKQKIEYFKTIGIDLGDNYEDYKNSPLAQSKIPPFTLINKIKEVKSHLIRQYDLSTNYANSSYFDLNNYIRDNNLDDQIFPKQIMEYIIEGRPITISVLQNNTLNLLVMMNFLDKEVSFNDRGLFHEINHCMSFKVIHIGKKHHTYQMGFISYLGDNSYSNQEYEEEPETGEEIFNEVINDLISIDILNLAKKENISILGETTRHSTYEFYFPLVQPFYEEFKEDIKEFYITGNFQALYKNISKRDFYKLIAIISEAKEYIDSTLDTELLDLSVYEKLTEAILDKMVSKKIKKRI